MFPKIPENLAGLTVAQLRELRREVKAAGKEALAVNKTETDPEARQVRHEAIRAALEVLPVLDAEIDHQEAEAAADDAFSDEVDEAEAETDDVDETDDADADADAEDDTDADADADAEDKVEVTAASTPAKVRRQVGASAKGAAVVPATRRVTAGQLLARDGIPGKNRGEAFENWTELAQALMDRSNQIDPQSDTHHEVAFVPGNYTEAFTLGEDVVDNFRKFDPDEITAAMCAPLPPNYDLGCMNTARRPVRASLPAFSAGNPRMGVRIYPSPSLADITTGVGVWTVANDNNPAAEKANCATITCASPVDYTMWGVYRCLTVTNMGHMSFPELTEAYLNRLAAAHARVAELQLLEAMATGLTTVFGEHVGYNATTSTVRVLLQYLNAYRELQRWDDQPMEVWLHRSVMSGLKADLVSRRNTSGDVLRVPSDAQINALFTDVGFTPHWVLDRPSWMTPIPQFSTGGKLADFPRNIEMLVAPRGKFGLLDRGQLSVGVTGNGIYRDNTSNKKNNFTFFFENFEGVVNTNSCPAHLLELNNVCWNGRQIDDIVIDCEGDVEVGTPGS